jgi:flagellar biosynthetic protein FlhB
VAEEEDRSSKTEQPTQRRLEDARRKGDVGKSTDLPAFFALAGACGMVLIGGGWMARMMTEAFLPFVAHPEAIDLSGHGAQGVMQAAARAYVPAALIMGAAAFAGAAGNFVQHGFLWAPQKLAPDFSKLNPIKGLGRMFGVDAFVNFLKTLVKLATVAAVAWMVLKPRMAELQDLPALNPAAILPLSFEITRALVIAVLCVMAAISGFDWFWSRFRFMQRMRMTREEVKQDHKESDGDPHVKQRQKQIRSDRSRRRMMQAVPKATVVVMNPTHYAVALKYDQGETAAPVCVAKGLDLVALKIRAIAEENDVPVIEDPPLARALYAAIDVDEAIPQEHYQAVAKIIGFILSEGRKTAQRRPKPLPPR